MTKRNWHAIVGANGMCECGINDKGEVVTCGNLLKEEFASQYENRMKEVVGKVEALDYFWQKEAPDKPLVSLDDVLALLQSNPE